MNKISYDILNMAKIIDGERNQNSGCFYGWREWGLTGKEMRDLSGVMKMFGN